MEIRRRGSCCPLVLETTLRHNSWHWSVRGLCSCTALRQKERRSLALALGALPNKLSRAYLIRLKLSWAAREQELNVQVHKQTVNSVGWQLTMMTEQYRCQWTFSARTAVLSHFVVVDSNGSAAHATHQQARTLLMLSGRLANIIIIEIYLPLGLESTKKKWTNAKICSLCHNLRCG